MRVLVRQGWSTLAVLGMLAWLVAGCRDQHPDATQSAVADRQALAQLVASNLAPRQGDEVVVAVELRRGGAIGAVASFTARLGYDATRLRVIGEYPLDDGATRVVNPLDGETRIAGIAVTGFGDGALFALRFTALSSDPFRGMLVAFDELHTTESQDLQKTVRTATQVIPRSTR